MWQISNEPYFHFSYLINADSEGLTSAIDDIVGVVMKSHLASLNLNPHDRVASKAVEQ